MGIFGGGRRKVAAEEPIEAPPLDDGEWRRTLKIAGHRASVKREKVSKAIEDSRRSAAELLKEYPGGRGGPAEQAGQRAAEQKAGAAVIGARNMAALDSTAAACNALLTLVPAVSMESDIFNLSETAQQHISTVLAAADPPPLVSEVAHIAGMLNAHFSSAAIGKLRIAVEPDEAIVAGRSNQDPQRQELHDALESIAREYGASWPPAPSPPAELLSHRTTEAVGVRNVPRLPPESAAQAALQNPVLDADSTQMGVARHFAHISNASAGRTTTPPGPAVPPTAGVSLYSSVPAAGEAFAASDFRAAGPARGLAPSPVVSQQSGRPPTHAGSRQYDARTASHGIYSTISADAPFDSFERRTWDHDSAPDTSTHRYREMTPSDHSASNLNDASASAGRVASPARNSPVTRPVLNRFTEIVDPDETRDRPQNIRPGVSNLPGGLYATAPQHGTVLENRDLSAYNASTARQNQSPGQGSGVGSHVDRDDRRVRHALGSGAYRESLSPGFSRSRHISPAINDPVAPSDVWNRRTPPDLVDTGPITPPRHRTPPGQRQVDTAASNDDDARYIAARASPSTNHSDVALEGDRHGGRNIRMSASNFVDNDEMLLLRYRELLSL